jgi:hypothetical protein
MCLCVYICLRVCVHVHVSVFMCANTQTRSDKTSPLPRVALYPPPSTLFPCSFSYHSPCNCALRWRPPPLQGPKEGDTVCSLHIHPAPGPAPVSWQALIKHLLVEELHFILMSRGRVCVRGRQPPSSLLPHQKCYFPFCNFESPAFVTLSLYICFLK